MCAREHASAPRPPPIIPVVTPGSSSASSASIDPYITLSAQLREHDLKMSANFERIEHRVQNDLQYICSSIWYLHTCVDETYSRNAWHAPLSRGHAQPLPTSGSPFDTWVPPPAPSEAPAPPEEWPLFCWWQKGGEILWSYLGVFTFYFHVLFMWTCSI